MWLIVVFCSVSATRRKNTTCHLLIHAVGFVQHFITKARATQRFVFQYIVACNVCCICNFILVDDICALYAPVSVGFFGSNRSREAAKRAQTTEMNTYIVSFGILSNLLAHNVCTTEYT